jgi:hypothetical protein
LVTTTRQRYGSIIVSVTNGKEDEQKFTSSRKRERGHKVSVVTTTREGPDGIIIVVSVTTRLGLLVTIADLCLSPVITAIPSTLVVTRG